MNLAQRHLEGWNIRSLQELLEVHIPGAGQEDLRGFEWYYFWRICHRSPLTLRNARPVGSEASAPGSEISATRSEDSVKRSRNMAIGLTTLKAHMDTIRFVNFSPDGKTLITSNIGSELKLWDVATGRKLAAIQRDLRMSDSGLFSPDGKRLAVIKGYYDDNIDPGNVKLLDATTGQELYTISWRAIIAVEFSPDSKTLAVISD